MTRVPLLLFSLGAVLALAACGNDNNETGTNPTNDTADSGVLDTGDDTVEDVTADTLPQDTTATDTAEDVTQTQPGEYGFTYRVPQTHAIKCSQGGGFGGDEPQNLTDTDWLCTFAHGGNSGYLYVQGTPVDCKVTMGAIPVLEAQGWFSDGTTATPLAKVAYDWGGGHHNDAITFDWNSSTYKAYHSSFGWGWRACQPMDCLVVSLNGAVVEDGCTTARTLPIVCVPIEADGGHGPLVDTFKKCAGDPN